MKKYLYKSLILFIAFTLFNCKEEAASEVTPQPHEQKLNSASLLYEVSASDLQNLAKALGQSEFADRITHGIAAYKLNYETTYQGESIEASGVMYLPKDLKTPAPILSLQHGTTFVKTDVPSASGTFTGFEYFAAGGYITFMPDFIGYGASADIFHPYYDQKHSALAVIDLVKAGMEYLSNENIPFNDQLLLAGYSEGGYVTMATAKELDINPDHGISVTAIAAGAGGYDLSQMLDIIRTNDQYPYPAYLAFVIMSYNETNGWNKPLNYFFQEPFASRLPALMDGSKNGDQVNAQLTTDLNELFNQEFYDRIKAGTETEFQSTLIENSIGLDSWVPQAPTRLYHGTDDVIVPVSNSEKVFDNLIKNGAEDIELIKISGGTHGNSILPMIQSIVPWFETIIGKES